MATATITQSADQLSAIADIENEQISALFSLIERRINFKRPSALEKNAMLDSVEKYLHSLCDSNTSAELSFFTDKGDKEGTVAYCIKYTSGSKNTQIVIRSDGSFYVEIPDSIEGLLRLSHSLGFDFAGHMYCLVMSLVCKGTPQCQTEEDTLVELKKLYKGKDLYWETSTIFPDIFKFLSKFNLGKTSE